MSLVLISPEDIVNAALARIGYKRRIGSIFEGSEPAKLALDIYGQTRDTLLRNGEWGFARRDITLTLIKSAPAGGYIPGVTTWSNAYPPLPWPYEYAYPSDCLKVRSIRRAPIFLPEFDPQPAVFDTPNDTLEDVVQQVIVCNLANAICTYTGQVTDPSSWEASFTETMVDELGKLLAPALNAQAVPVVAAEGQMAEAKANVTQG